MATGGDWTLDDSTIARLAKDISTKHLVTIAESYMKISYTTIENIKFDYREAEAINGEILRTWRNRYSGSDQRLVSDYQIIVFTNSNTFFQPKDWVHKLQPLCSPIITIGLVKRAKVIFSQACATHSVHGIGHII